MGKNGAMGTHTCGRRDPRRSADGDGDDHVVFADVACVRDRGCKMIKIITETDPRPNVVDRLYFKYWNAETERWHDRVLSLKGLIQARKSGNNTEWSVYYGAGWHSDIWFIYDIRIPEEITIVILNRGVK